MSDDKPQEVTGTSESPWNGDELRSRHEQLEAALRESEARLRTLIDYLPAEVWAMDTDLRFIMQNPASTRIVGHVVGKRIEDLSVAPETKRRWMEQDRQVLAGNTLRQEYQVEVAGEPRAYENVVAPIRVDEVVVGLVGVALDITARKRSEEALQQARAELEQRVATRTADLARANRMLKILLACSQAVVRATEEQQMLQEICSILVDLGGYPLVWIGLGEPDTAQRARSVAQAGRDDTDYASFITLPLRADDHVLGALHIYAAAPDAFHEQEVQLLVELAGDLAFGIASLRERAARSRVDRVQAAIYRISEAAQSTPSLDDLFASIHTTIAQLMPAQNFYIALYERAADVIRFPYYADEFDAMPPPQKMGRGLTDLVLRTGTSLLATPTVFEQLVQSGDVESLGAPSVDWLGVPLKTQRGETIGVMAVQIYTGDVRLHATDQEILEFVSTQVAMAIERKRSDEALQRSEEKYRLLVENLSDVIFTLDAQGLFTYISRAIEHYTGFPADQVIGQPFTRFIHPDDLPGLLDSFERSLAGQSEPSEFRVYSREGTVRYVRTASRTIVEEGRVVGVTGVMSDITGRIQTEEALRESEEKYRVLYEDNPSMYFTVDPAGAVLSVNRFGYEQLGYTAEEIVGRSVLQVFHPEDRDAATRSIGLCVENPGQVFHWELRKVHKAGHVKWAKETARALRGSDGQVVVFIVCEDITKRKRAEQEREKLQAQLFQAQKMETLGRLAGGVAHDFNNMLLAILGHTELALRRCHPEDPLFADLKVIEESTHRSAGFVRQLLAFARKQTVAPRILDLNAMVTGMLGMLQRLIGEEIDLLWAPGLDVWPVEIDPSQLDQLLVNLCVNARDAVAGVGKVTIETRDAVFEEAYCAAHPGFVRGEYVLLAVSDDGCGMTGEVLEHLFEPFFTTKPVGKGTGLGLATVYGIVKQNEGFVNVYSEPGKGSTFSIYLPRFAQGAAEPALASVPETPPSQGETLLLVEDEAAILKVARAMLEELGYRVLSAATPGEALRQAEAHAAEIQLLITDVVMPEMSGRDLAESIAILKPGLRVLFTSGYTGDVIAHRGVLDKGVHFLQKPFSLEDLAAKVRDVLDQK